MLNRVIGGGHARVNQRAVATSGRHQS